MSVKPEEANGVRQKVADFLQKPEVSKLGAPTGQLEIENERLRSSVMILQQRLNNGSCVDHNQANKKLKIEQKDLLDTVEQLKIENR